MMKNNIKLSRNNRLVLIIIIALCLCSIAYGVTVYRKMDKVIYGTYRSVNPTNDCLLILKKDSSYMLYEEYQILDEGTYQVEYSYEHVKVCRLNSEKNTKLNRVINFDGKECLMMGEESNVIMKKISDINVYINLDELPDIRVTHFN